MNSHYDTDVLVVGAGPAGLVLALDLARRGVRTHLVEREDGTFPGSRAKGVQPRTLEVFDDLGVSDAIVSAGDVYPPMGVHVGPLRLSWKMYRRRAADAQTPYPNILLLGQSSTTAILRQALVDRPVQVSFGVGVEEVLQENDSATAVLSTGERIRARYVVGADGGGSTVRKSAGLAFSGATDESDRMIVADATIDGLSRDRWHVWPRTGGRFTGACPLPGPTQFQIMIRLHAGEEKPDLSEPALAQRFAKLTGGRYRLHDLTWASVFRPNIRLVEHYRKGRVLLCGDAAHVHTPAGAQGLNTGVQDAYNLGWKLAQVLAGAPDELLDSYEGERRPVAAQVLGRSTELYEGLNRTGLSKLSRSSDDSQLSISYFGGPLAPPGGTRTRTLRVGDRAPDGLLPGQGRLFDLYRGPHFTLLAFGPKACAALSEVAWPDRVAALSSDPVTGQTAVGAALLRHAVSDRTDGGPAAQVLAAYGIEGDTQLLIRPDGYIGHIAAADWPASLARATALLAPAGMPASR
jgi:2-polyprenyl-6-methoxyphenol hydroxylase-like FAD-dependent oxidoreductase